MKMHYDYRSLAGRWGVFLAKVLRIKTAVDREWDAARRSVGLPTPKRWRV